jgi:Concanavalin A-like lectin/glucanases superfamily
VLSDAPRAYWRLGETSGTSASDELGAAPGTYLSGAVLGAPGALAGDANTAVGLDGVDDRVSMGDPASGALDFGTGDFSAEAWVRTTVNGERTIVSKRPSTGPYWQFTVTDDSGHAGQIRVNASDGTTTRQAYGPARRVDDGAWHHVVVVFDRDTGIVVYVDGVSQATAGPLTGDVSSSGPFLVGKATGYGYLAGDVDEVAVYPAALPAARVAAHYSAARS